ncbi:hypothetical protein L9F63_008282, partial [Diploptera punctata]
MWYVVYNQEVLQRLRRYLKRVLRQCLIVVYKVRASASARRNNNNGTSAAVAFIMSHP